MDSDRNINPIIEVENEEKQNMNNTNRQPRQAQGIPSPSQGQQVRGVSG